MIQLPDSFDPEALHKIIEDSNPVIHLPDTPFHDLVGKHIKGHLFDLLLNFSFNYDDVVPYCMQQKKFLCSVRDVCHRFNTSNIYCIESEFANFPIRKGDSIEYFSGSHSTSGTPLHNRAFIETVTGGMMQDESAAFSFWPYNPHEVVLAFQKAGPQLEREFQRIIDFPTQLDYECILRHHTP